MTRTTTWLLVVTTLCIRSQQQQQLFKRKTNFHNILSLMCVTYVCVCTYVCKNTIWVNRQLLLTNQKTCSSLLMNDLYTCETYTTSAKFWHLHLHSSAFSFFFCYVSCRRFITSSSMSSFFSLWMFVKKFFTFISLNGSNFLYLTYFY